MPAPHHVATHCLADQQLARSGQVADALGDGHREATEVIATYLDLAGVHACLHNKSHVLGTGHDFSGTTKRSPRGIEGGKKTIPRRLHLMSTVAAEGGSDHGIVSISQP